MNINIHLFQRKCQQYGSVWSKKQFISITMLCALGCTNFFNFLSHMEEAISSQIKNIQLTTPCQKFHITRGFWDLYIMIDRYIISLWYLLRHYQFHGGGFKGHLFCFIAPNPFGVEGRLRWRLKDNYGHITKPPKKCGLDHLEAVEAASKMSIKIVRFWAYFCQILD